MLQGHFNLQIAGLGPGKDTQMLKREFTAHRADITTASTSE
jgi:hypothetical protein